MEEVWKDIPKYEGIYQASNLGRIKSLARQDRRGHGWPTKILKPDATRNGYLQVLLSRDGVITKKYVHHLILEVFVGPCPPGKQRNHINGDKADNSIGNLEYCTGSENHFHSYRVLGKQAAKGSKQGGAKLNEEQVQAIRRLHAAKQATGQELAKMFNISESSISAIVLRQRWKHL